MTLGTEQWIGMFALDFMGPYGLMGVNPERVNATSQEQLPSGFQARIDKDDPSKLSFLGLGLSTLCLLVPIALSLRLSLGLHVQLAVSAIRMILQLTLLGFILVPLFSYSNWWMVLLYSAFMTCVAALEAGQRPSHRYQGQYLHTLLALAMGAWSLIMYAALVVLQLRPLWEAQYVIPVLGMLLGSATSGVSVGLNTTLQDLASSKEYIELLLALGANRTEATKAVVKKALTNAMMPTINMMAVMGLVSIPGMMTGQILAGADPSDASRYQMMIVFLISGSTGIAAMAAVHMAVWHVVDEGAHYRPERILPRRNLSETWRIRARRFYTALGRTKDLCLTCLCCVTPSSMSARWQKRPSPLSRYEMMYELGDEEEEDEEEGLQGDVVARQALMPHRTPARGMPGGLYQQGGRAEGEGHTMDGGLGGTPSGVMIDAWQLSSPRQAGEVGSLGLNEDAAAKLQGSPLGGTAQQASGLYGAVPSPGKPQHLLPELGHVSAGPYHMEPPPTVSVDMPEPPRGSRRLLSVASALGLRLAHAAYDRLGPGSSSRSTAASNGQYVPLSGSTNSSTGPLAADLEHGREGLGGRRVGTESSQQADAGTYSGQEDDAEVGMKSAAGSEHGDSGASTPLDDEQYGSPEFFDAQSVSGSSFSSATGFIGSRRASYSSLQGLRGGMPLPDQQTPRTGRFTPPRT